MRERLLHRGDYDAVIIGGGPAGAAAALTLGGAGAQVIVLEANSGPKWKIGETLAPEGRQILQMLNLWAGFQRQNFLPSPGNCSAWGANELTSKDHILNPFGCGWQLDRARFESFLLEAVCAIGGHVQYNVRIDAIQQRSGSWQLNGSNHDFRAKWLIDATGRMAAAARTQGVARHRIDDMISLYVVLPSDDSRNMDTRTFIEACPDGWWYSALTPCGLRTIAFHTDADLLPPKQWRDPDWLRARLRETLHIWPLAKTCIDEIKCAPKLTSARTGSLDRSAGDYWFAVGDAALSMDPLSGQGIFNAMLTGYLAGKLITEPNPETSTIQAKYTEIIDQLLRRFLQSRQSLYGSEHRWPDKAFWSRRVAIPQIQKQMKNAELKQKAT